MNIVFDLGGVLVDWCPDNILKPFDLVPDAVETLKAALFGHPDWISFDRGDIDVVSLSRRAALRSGFDEAFIRRIVESVPGALVPFDPMIDLVRKLSASEHHTFFLSNLNAPSLAHLERILPFDELFDGYIASCEVRFAKPDPEIYKSLIDTYTLLPDETVFFDDIAENVAGAENVGIRGELYTGIDACIAVLNDLGIAAI